MKNWNKPRLLVFDVNETLLDMGLVKVEINRFFNNEGAFQIWFSTLLQYAMVESINPPNKYRHFGKIAVAGLQMLSKKLQIAIKEEDIDRILTLMVQLPTHKDVSSGLSALKAKGYSMVALTNGTVDVLKKQMSHADLSHFFEAVYSVESVESYKPQKITYQYVLDQQHIKAEEAMMVAAHSWDITGANAAGLQTTFIARPGQMYYPLMEEPSLVCKDLLELANRM